MLEASFWLALGGSQSSNSQFQIPVFKGIAWNYNLMNFLQTPLWVYIFACQPVSVIANWFLSEPQILSYTRLRKVDESNVGDGKAFDKV